MLKRTVLMIFLIFFLVGCATQKPQLTRKESLRYTQRIYKNHSRDEIFKAARNVFEHSDQGDFKFDYINEDTMRAINQWMVYVVLAYTRGKDFWTVETEKKKEGIEVNVNLKTVSGGMVAGAYGPMTIPEEATSPDGTAIYAMFWKRLNYMLGERQSWFTCNDIENLKKKNSNVFGNVSAFCRLGTDPNNPS